MVGVVHAVVFERGWQVSTPKHTPLPWFEMNSHKAGFRNIAHQDPNDLRHTTHICELFPSTEAVPNCSFIVTACNAHYDLLNACKAALPLLERMSTGVTKELARDAAGPIKAAITKAGGAK